MIFPCQSDASYRGKNHIVEPDKDDKERMNSAANGNTHVNIPDDHYRNTVTNHKRPRLVSILSEEEYFGIKDRENEGKRNKCVDNGGTGRSGNGRKHDKGSSSQSQIKHKKVYEKYSAVLQSEAKLNGTAELLTRRDCYFNNFKTDLVHPLCASDSNFGAIMSSPGKRFDGLIQGSGDSICEILQGQSFQVNPQKHLPELFLNMEKYQEIHYPFFRSEEKCDFNHLHNEVSRPEQCFTQSKLDVGETSADETEYTNASCPQLNHFVHPPKASTLPKNLTEKNSFEVNEGCDIKYSEDGLVAAKATKEAYKTAVILSTRLTQTR
eukprot:CAMPEP_0195534302 /NCGR_PEP_ID=MMETSP0794_2-20130614/42135_1 /TAXON_ID=515487 /ORGANISM="Stephanopyxis turris, Strain CCMP 815" /LENGTH=322 /DNA_ID=CAMNT_0040667105 /DNA_START=108 /DNA_END=1076 /DNA_ORIENTATION=-